MNEQEMQFADPDWQPQGSWPRPQENAAAGPPPVQPVRSALPADAHQAAGVSAYEQGYRASTLGEDSLYATPVAQKAASRPVRSARRRSFGWFWFIIIVLAFSLFGGAWRSSFNHRAGYQEARPGPLQGNAYILKNSSLLTIDDLSGSVTVQVDPAQQSEVVVQSDDGTQPEFSYTTDGARIHDNSSGNVTVMVPLNMALSLDINAASIEIDGFTGRVSAQTGSGEIALNGDHLLDQSSIHSQTGDITLMKDEMAGQVTVQTGGAGNIDFTGVLDVSGTYQFLTEDGDITMNLPADTSMQVSPPQGGGTYQSDFANAPGTELRAVVTVETTRGNIRIHNENQ